MLSSLLDDQWASYWLLSKREPRESPSVWAAWDFMCEGSSLCPWALATGYVHSDRHWAFPGCWLSTVLLVPLAMSPHSLSTLSLSFSHLSHLSLGSLSFISKMGKFYHSNYYCIIYSFNISCQNTLVAKVGSQQLTLFVFFPAVYSSLRQWLRTLNWLNEGKNKD